MSFLPRIKKQAILIGIALVLVGIAGLVLWWIIKPGTIDVSGYPTSPRTQEAMNLYSQNKLQESQKIYQEIVAGSPKDFVAWNGLGNVLRDTGDYKGAEEAYLRVITLKPAFEFVYRNLLALYQLWPDENLKNEKLASYKDFIEKGLSANPRSVNILDAAIQYCRLTGDTTRVQELEELLAKID